MRVRLRLRNTIKKEMKMDVEVKELIGVFNQTYSHFKLTLHVYDCFATGKNKKGRWVAVGDLHLLPMSKIDRRISESILS